MDQKELLRYGNELTICGFVVGNALLNQVIMLPSERATATREIIHPTDEEIHQIIRQMDVQEIEGLQKVILRKSQRQIDTHVSWQVFRRDGFKCVYCGADDVPMTVDHIVLWENMGDTVTGNLNCSCKKCNKTRGSIDYEDWLKSDYIYSQSHKRGLSELMTRGEIAKTLPLRKTKRSR